MKNYHQTTKIEPKNYKTPPNQPWKITKKPLNPSISAMQVSSTLSMLFSKYKHPKINAEIRLIEVSTRSSSQYNGSVFSLLIDASTRIPLSAMAILPSAYRLLNAIFPSVQWRCYSTLSPALRDFPISAVANSSQIIACTSRCLPQC